MAIANAVQRGGLIIMYDEKGRQLGATAAGDGLYGFTATSVSVRKGGLIVTYDEKGRQTGAISGR